MKMFKNAIFYTCDFPTIKFDSLRDALTPNEFKPCKPSQGCSLGWVAPYADKPLCLVERIGTDYIDLAANNTMLTHVYLICMLTEEKQVPASAVNKALDERIKEIEEKEQREITPQERDELQYDVRQELLKKAFSKYCRTYVILDVLRGVITVDASTYERAEDLINLLRDSLGTLEAKYPQVARKPSKELSNWLFTKVKPVFSSFYNVKGMLTGDVELISADPKEDKSKIRFTNSELTEEELDPHFEVGRQVSKLSFEIGNDNTFFIQGLIHITGDAFRFTKLRLDPGEDVAVNDNDSDDLELTREVNVLLTANALYKLYIWFVHAFGGLDDTHKQEQQEPPNDITADGSSFTNPAYEEARASLSAEAQQLNS